MAQTVLTIMAALGFFAWGIAVLSSIRLVALAPKGQRLSTYGKIGWWQFAEIRQLIGPASEPHIRAYQRSVITFIALVFLAMGAGILLGAAA